MTWEYKSYRNWRQIFKSPEIDLCEALVISDNMPFLQKLKDGLQEAHPFFPSSCPIAPRAEYYYNIRIANLDSGRVYMPGGLFRLPNGLYRYRLFANTKDDPVGGYIEWVIEVTDRLNFDKF
jgi:hypothetical protein